MLNGISKSATKGLIFVFALIVISVPFQERIDNIRGKFRFIEETLYFSSSSLKKISLGYKELLADIYWLRAIQYFGGKKLEETNPELLYRYFDIITDLDPKFVNAYRYGGTFLAEPPPIGLGDIEKGIKLFDKGRKNNPDNFRLPYEEAFIYYLYVKDYEKAAELFNEASEKPGLSDFRRASIKGMAALAHSRGGSRELSRKIWKEIYETTTNEGRKEFALRNLKELATMDVEDRLTKALREYIRRYNEVPTNLEVLKDAGIIRQVPKEVFGGKFVIVDKLRAIKSSTLINQQLKYNTAFLTAKAQRFKKYFGRYPKDLYELREYIENDTIGEFPPHPLGEEYVYNPETGVVKSK
jgi:tetratricopeptide (TPR) repeat protein